MSRKCLDTCILVTKKDKTSQLTAKKHRKLIQAINKKISRISNTKELSDLKEEKMFHSDVIKSTERLSKRMMYNCTRKICNPGCKNTIFEPKLHVKKVVDDLLASRYQNPADLKIWKTFLRKTVKEDRKRLFGRKKNILVDGFYEKLDPGRVELLKKMGAISGCLTNRGDNRLGVTQP